MKSTTITCDTCGKDLTATGAMPAYRYVLTPETIEHAKRKDGSYFSYAVAVYPWIKRPHHFCGRECLAKWMEENKD